MLSEEEIEAIDWLSALDIKSEYEATNKELILNLVEKQNEIIDKMSLKIVKTNSSNTYCLGKNKKCPYDKPTLNKCKECVRYYYEKRCKHGNC